LKTEQPKKEVLYFLYQFLMDIGFNRQTENLSKSERRAWIEKIHDLLIVHNDRVPNNADYEALYLKFTKEAIYGDVEIKEKTVKAVLVAFNTWLNTQEIIRPKALPAPNPDENKHLNPNLIYWTDDEIQRQISILAKIGMQGFLGNDAGRGYMARLGNEAKKRGLEVVDIKLDTYN